MTQLPIAFLPQMQAQLQEEWPQFEAALTQQAPTSIRWNRRKIGLQPNIEEPIPWNEQGSYLSQRPVFTLDPLLHAGAYYVQEASSMLLGVAVQQLIGPSRPIRALDLCAAPGGKTSLLADQLSAESLILANEVIKSRYHVLQENLTKWGAPNVYFSNHDSAQLAKLAGFFDLVVVDAPCSGEGLFRKSPDAIQEWSTDAVSLCAARQKRILAEAVQTLAPEGILIYCTCTYNDIENEANAHWLAKEFELTPMPLALPEAWGVRTKAIGYQCYPHLVKGEGFYISCFQKKTGKRLELSPKVKFEHWQALPKKHHAILQKWVESPSAYHFFIDASHQIYAILKEHTEAIQNIDQHLKRRMLGKHIGTIKGKDFIPSATLALSLLRSTSYPSVELNKEQALRFLKRETIELADPPQGWQLVTFQTQALGWIKGIKRRINNYYPKEWRIRMNIK
ncbi:MAG: RNA methyltransferase [Bacteroidota bacterium]